MSLDITGLGSLFDLGAKVLDKIFPDKEAADKAKLELLKVQQQGQLLELEKAYGAILAEAQSSDPWTSRARPSFLYVFYFLLVVMIVVGPLIGIFFPLQMTAFYGNVAKGFEAIPEELWWTFSAGYLGYTGARTFEKKKGVK